MLTVVDQEYKSHANSFANMSYNLLGYLQAPSIYGYVNDEDDKSRNGMKLLMWATVPAVALIGIASVIRKVKKPNT